VTGERVDPNRAGGKWERRVVDYLVEAYGRNWDRAPLRGRRDRLDVTGCLDDGYLIGCKAITRGVAFGQRVSEAMAQCDQALINVGRPVVDADRRGFLVVDSGLIMPLQVMQRSGYPTGKAYVVTELDYWARTAVERAELRKLVAP
jgi:hypothetical protein